MVLGKQRFECTSLWHGTQCDVATPSLNRPDLKAFSNAKTYPLPIVDMYMYQEYTEIALRSAWRKESLYFFSFLGDYNKRCHLPKRDGYQR